MKFSTIKLGTHIWVPTKEIDLRASQQRYTFFPRGGGEPVPLYDQQDGWFGVPRHAHKLDEFRSSRAVSELADGEDIRIRHTSTLRPEQRVVMDAFQRKLQNKQIGFVIEAPPGWGKTVAALAMIAAVGKTALIVVPQTPLVHQWVQRTVEHTSLRLSDVGTVIGRKADWKGKRLVVALVHSLRLGYLKEDFRRYFGQIWYDEIHSSVPPATFAPAAGMFPARVRAGLSATLDRYDGGQSVFHAHVGQCFLRAQSNEGRMSPVIVAHTYGGNSGPLPPIENKNMRRGILMTKLAGDRRRNDIIADYSALLYRNSRKHVIISDRTQQLSLLRYLLTTEHGVPESDIGFFARTLVGLDGCSRNISNNELEQTKKKQIILATYGMMKQGTDIPDLSGLIYGTPQSDVRQTKGRIERLVDGKKQPLVIDIVDAWYPDAKGWFYKRLRLYKSENLEIKQRETVPQ